MNLRLCLIVLRARLRDAGPQLIGRLQYLPQISLDLRQILISLDGGGQLFRRSQQFAEAGIGGHSGRVGGQHIRVAGIAHAPNLSIGATLTTGFIKNAAKSTNHEPCGIQVAGL